MASSEKDYVVIYRPFITLRNGRRLYARQIGKKAFPIKIKKPRK